jgi:hypothetical protein
VRVAYIILGALTLLWLPLEETGVRNPQALALAAGVLVGVSLWVRRLQAASGSHWLRSVGIGGLAGLVTAPLAVFLMIFKSGLHSHGFPEYSTSQILDVLGRTPLWTAAGSVAGLLAGLWPRGHLQQE